MTIPQILLSESESAVVLSALTCYRNILYDLARHLPITESGTIDGELMALNGIIERTQDARCVEPAGKCQRCSGTGAIDAPFSGSDPSCPECDGEGTIPPPPYWPSLRDKLFKIDERN